MQGFLKTGKADRDLSRYFPNILPINRQLQIAGKLPRKAYASVTYSHKKQLEFILDLTTSTYGNYRTMEICLPLKFTKKSNKALQMNAQMMTVNNFLGHWFTNIDIRHYPDDMRILPTNNSVDIYQYSNAQMKYLPEKLVKNLLKTMLYSNKPVYLTKDVDRKSYNDNSDAKWTDPNLTYRLAELKDYIFEKNVYRVPLSLIVDLGLVNLSFKTNAEIILTLEKKMNKLFESNEKVTAIPDNPDALIQFYDRPYISYQEINLTKSADIYFTSILRSETALRQGVLPSPYQQLFEINTGTQSFTCTFKGAPRQFDWFEISIVYDKSFQHTTIYNSYDLEIASKLIKTIKFENTSTTYSLTGKLWFDIEKGDNKNILYNMPVAKTCDGCSTAPLTQYKNNEIYQEIKEEDKFTSNETDDRIYIDMRRSKGYTDELEKLNHDDSGLPVAIGLKEAAPKKLRVQITGFSQAKYWYLLSSKGYIISYKNYNISKADESW